MSVDNQCYLCKNPENENTLKILELCDTYYTKRYYDDIHDRTFASITLYINNSSNNELKNWFTSNHISILQQHILGNHIMASSSSSYSESKSTIIHRKHQICFSNNKTMQEIDFNNVSDLINMDHNLTEDDNLIIFLLMIMIIMIICFVIYIINFVL